MRTLLFVLPMLVACGGGQIGPAFDDDDVGDDDAPIDALPVDTAQPDTLLPDADPPPPVTRIAVAVGWGSKRARSLDGVSWTDFAELQNDAPEDENLFRGVGFGGGRFVAVGGSDDGLIQTSIDGKTWSAPDHSPRAWLAGAVYFNGHYVVAGGNGLRMWSDDAVTWTEGGVHQQVHYRDLAASDTIAVAVGHTTPEGVPHVGVISTTSDGKTWVERRRGGQEHNRIAFGNGVFVVGGHAGKIERSTDGIAWSEVAVASSRMNDIVFTGTEFIISVDGKHFRSTDGLAWTSQASVRPITAVLGDRYLFFSFRPSTIQATTDLSAWSPVFTPGGTGFTRMAVGDVP